MMLPVVAIRGEPGLSQTLALAASKGITVTGIPLFRVEPVPWELPEESDFDALLIGSANAIRHGGKALHRLSHLPVFAVGAQTAKAASEAGFTVAHIGQGGLQSVLDNDAAVSKQFLRLSGRQRVALDLRSGQEMVEIVTYDNRAISAPADLGEQLRNGGTVLLHSAAAMVHLGKECGRIGLDVSRITLAALGPRIIDSAGDGWAAIHTAPTPDDAALLDMVKALTLA